MSVNGTLEGSRLTGMAIATAAATGAAVGEGGAVLRDVADVSALRSGARCISQQAERIPGPLGASLEQWDPQQQTAWLADGRHTAIADEAIPSPSPITISMTANHILTRMVPKFRRG